MIHTVEEIELGGLKYEAHYDCFGERAFYITPEGGRQELLVHGWLMATVNDSPTPNGPTTAMEAIKLHAMNSKGYSL